MTSGTTKGQGGSGGLRRQQQMQDGGPSPKCAGPKSVRHIKPRQTREKPSQRALRGLSGEAHKHSGAPRRATGHNRRRQESDELWLCAEQWRWTGYGKPQKRKRM
eukprot:6214634-Pleurochrysis_carterae.AAC.6